MRQLIGRIAFWLSWPALWVYLRGSRRARVIVITGDKVLLVKLWLSAGSWILPGGGIHRGENHLAAAVREVREETGVVIDPVQLKTVTEGVFSDYGLKFKGILYLVELDTEQPIRVQKTEIAKAVWQPLGQLENLSPLTKRLLSSQGQDVVK